MTMININIKLLSDTATVPTRGSQYSAGWDLYADIEGRTAIFPHTTVKISAGIAAEIPEGYFGGIFARSGLATKQGLRPSNCVGVCDSDYRGPIIVALHNDTNEIQYIHPQERIAQLVIMPYLDTSFSIVDSLSDTVRGEGGFGSTGSL